MTIKINTKQSCFHYKKVAATTPYHCVTGGYSTVTRCNTTPGSSVTASRVSNTSSGVTTGYSSNVTTGNCYKVLHVTTVTTNNSNTDSSVINTVTSDIITVLPLIAAVYCGLAAFHLKITVLKITDF